ncbi:MAG: N-acyl homoserine lactonase family protein [Rhodospirillales bacterium]
MIMPYEVYALKFSERSDRVRADSFLFDDHEVVHPIDYFLWVIRNEERTVVVDTGYDAEEGAHRGRPILRDPGACLTDMGIAPETVETVVITHLHYDHAGALQRFPAATFHLQAAELAFATGPCMCEPALNHPFTAAHICQMVAKVFSGRVVFHQGDADLAPGIELIAIGGHSRGLQAVRVMTQKGWLVLASDASHFFENYLQRKMFPIVVDAEATLRGFDRLRELAEAPHQVIPGHDPLVRRLFPLLAGNPESAGLYRLDVEPLVDPKALLADILP